MPRTGLTEHSPAIVRLDQAPPNHATRHVTGGGDVIADAVASGNSGLMSGADKTKLDGVAAGATVGADWNTNVANKPTLGAMAAVADAPSDGSTYGRKNAAWVAVGGGPGTAKEAHVPLITLATEVAF